MKPSKRDWIDAYIDGLEHENQTGHVSIELDMKSGRIVKVKVTCINAYVKGDA